MSAAEKIYGTQEQEVLHLLESVSDPEVPVLSVIDLGIIRNIVVDDEGHGVEVTITPTYSGCPAMDVIALNIRFALLQEGFTTIKINMTLSPAWTTDWMSEAGKNKLKAFGIAPPSYSSARNKTVLFGERERVECPLCHSEHTTIISEFGSTACKALYKCDDCKEPFDHFKCH